MPLEVPPTEGIIAFCPVHWSELARILSEAMPEGDMKVYGSEVTLTIISTALQFFGGETILKRHAGCPACAFSNVPQLVAERVATKYRTVN